MTVSDVFFSGKGKYKCTVRLNGQVKATTTITVDVKKDMDNVEMDDDDASDTYYYEDSEILFCKSVDKQGNTTGEASTFALGTTKQITLTVYTENDGNPFKTKEVYATIYKNNKVVKEYDLDITPEWTYFSFKHTFTEPGEYVVDLYNGKDVFINSATLTITK
ncbi:MAG: hypothetical protein IPM85_03035 [Chitinophagaceae bacterium]|nr:hypothetical protein [Chitinophagaceae bacterium]